MPEVSFAKFHGLGNDFVILDGIASPDLSIDGEQARRLADRREGIGADQVLLLTKGEDGEFGYRIWNQDGGEVAQCGNGARSAHAFLRQRGHSDGRTKLRTKAGLIEVEDGEEGPRAFLGVPEFEPERIPLAADRRMDKYPLEWNGNKTVFAAVAIGNPHCIIEVDDLDCAPVEGLGSFLNESEMFPEGVNVSFLKKESDTGFSLRVYERGVGETPACGSAAAACAVIHGGRDAEGVEIEVRGGRLRAGWKGSDAMAWVEGKVAHAFDGNTAEHLLLPRSCNRIPSSQRSTTRPSSSVGRAED